MTRKTYAQQKKRLKWTNIAAWIFHWAVFTVSLVVILTAKNSAFKVNVDISSKQEVAGVLVTTTADLFTFELAITVLMVPVLTGISHALLGLVPVIRRHYSRKALNIRDGSITIPQEEGTGFNPYRWGEYCVTASILTFSLALTSGASDIGSLLGLVTSNVMMQLCGAAHEWVNQGWTPARSRWPNLWFYAAGFLPFVYTWVYIFWVFVRAAEDGLPAFIWALIFGIFFQYSLFVVPIALRYNPWWRITNFQYEECYNALSFSSKAFFDLTLAIGVATR